MAAGATASVLLWSHKHHEAKATPRSFVALRDHAAFNGT
jgi:hypothetical protein